MKMSVLNNFTVSIGRGLRRIRDNELVTRAARRRGTSTESQPDRQKLNMEKCLIVSKVTRYEYEKYSHDNIPDLDLERILRERGSDYDAMLANHKEQKAFETRIADTLTSMGHRVEMASRLTYKEDLINWCDVVLPCGGDGTFLLAASKVRDNNKPVIGFNSAPHKSVGRLCLPTWCSNDVKGALHALKEGKFRWMRRSRIRTTVTSEPKLLDKITPVDLHTLQYCRYPPTPRIEEQDEEDSRIPQPMSEDHKLSTKVLPYLALNEVFIGESVTSRVSLLRLQIDNGQWTHTKSSGLCVTTGTGSTSWHYSINCLRTHSVLELMKILSEELNVNVDTRLETAREITEMYNQRLIFPPGIRDNELVTRAARRRGTSTESQPDRQKLNMEKCLIVSKVTRYEYEKYSHDNIPDLDLERILRERGSDYDAMLANHKEQKAFETRIADTLTSMGHRVEMASRLTYKEDLINWCDVVLPCGGDGTFLLAASKVRDNNKPVIGFNSAPHKSVGRLCLPTWCSNDVKGALHALKEGKFRWMRRSRIRTTVTSEPKLLDKITPVDLHTLQYCRYPPTPRIEEQDEEDSRIPQPMSEDHKLSTKVLPYLALNEVFIGESVTSRVSLLRLQIDNGQWTHTKSSGLCVTTGTGSTSWHYSINCLRTHSVLELMKILSEELNVNVDTRLETAREITEMYNQRLIFPPDSEYLAYSVREYIRFEEWPTPRGLRVRDKAATVSVKSHCTDAGLVIDGSVSFPFNDGTEALLEIHPEDSLMTVQMDDELPY